MLICGSVEDNIWLICLKDKVHSLFVPYISYHKLIPALYILVCHIADALGPIYNLQFYVMKRCLRIVHK